MRFLKEDYKEYNFNEDNMFDYLNNLIDNLPVRYQDKINEIENNYEYWTISCTSPYGCKKLDSLLSPFVYTEVEIDNYGAYINISKDETNEFIKGLKAISDKK